MSTMQLIEVKKKDLFVDWDFNCRGKVNPSAPATLSLAADIEQNGLQNPLIVSKSDDATNAGYLYQLVAGHRRYTAMCVNNVHKFDAILKQLEPADMLIMNLTENVQREELDVLQESKGISALRLNGLSLQVIADRIGMSFGWVQVRNQLASLPQDIQEGVRDCRFAMQQIRDLYTIWLTKDETALYELFCAIKDSKGKGVKVNVDKFKKERPKSKKKLRASAEIHEIQEVIHGLLGPNIINITLGWVNAEVTDIEFHEAIKHELSIYDLEYIIPDFDDGR